MKDHSEFPTKPNYQAIAESLEAENKILTQQVELQTKRLETLQQGVKDAIDEIYNDGLRSGSDISNIKDDYQRGYLQGYSYGCHESVNILTEKTGISA